MSKGIKIAEGLAKAMSKKTAKRVKAIEPEESETLKHEKSESSAKEKSEHCPTCGK